MGLCPKIDTLLSQPLYGKIDVPPPDAGFGQTVGSVFTQQVRQERLQSFPSSNQAGPTSSASSSIPREPEVTLAKLEEAIRGARQTASSCS